MRNQLFLWSEWGDLNSRLLEPKSSALPTGLHPDIQFYMVANADFTQEDNRCQEKTVEKRFLAVVVKTVVKTHFETVLRNMGNGNVLVSQHILGLQNKQSSVWIRSPKSSALPAALHPDTKDILYSICIKNATEKYEDTLCLFCSGIV